MPRTLYCWRCRKDVPMLTDEEWAAVEPHLENRFEAAARYCEAHPEATHCAECPNQEEAN